jgi:ATP-dependent RNA helicase DeaD
VAITLAEPREHRLLKAIERVTGQRIAVEKIPTVADLQARRLELTRSALQESLLSDDLGDHLDRYRVVVETLTDQFDVMDVALAAVKLAHDATAGDAGDTDQAEIPQPAGERVPRPDRDRRAGRSTDGRSIGGATTWLYLGLGRSAGVRPQDLVGAIAGESRLTGHDVGAIEIADRFSLVEVPEAAAEEVIAALRGSTIKGRKTTVRREREPRNPRPARRK